MPLLPPNPDVVQSPTVGSPAGQATRGAPSGIGAIAHEVGKPGATQHLGNITGRRGAGMSTLTGGDAAMHSMGHYGKDPPVLLGMPSAPGADPTMHAGAARIRGVGGGGGVRKARQGGLGPVQGKGVMG